MRLLAALFFSMLTIALIFILNTKWLTPIALGKFLSPQHGFWQNAESVNNNFSQDLSFSQLNGKASVYFDERLVPHVFAENDKDVYFIQGYLHAKFRLWQMDLQTRAAAGRVAEVIGEKGLDHDREFRRLGMVYAAENSLREMEKDEVTKQTCDAYTAGVNEYIKSLTESTLPLEYKLLDFSPEPWSNLKTALFLKYMAYDLSHGESDFEMTNAKSFFNKEDFDLLYPKIQDSLDPIIPKGTKYPALLKPFAIPPNVDSLYFATPISVEANKPDKDNGSNNWAVSGSKTASGFPILCNDPHLGLNLPSLWYEMQLTTPDFTSYGATFPGAPNIIIGFNNDCSWGFTNGGRDVMDYYEIQFKDDSRQEYFFDGKWLQTNFRIENIKVTGKSAYTDTVAYTIFGPVMFDKNYAGKRTTNKKNYAVRWKAHDASNELLIFYGLNRAKNYDDYQKAVVHLHNPGQNVVFACRNGDIALRTQGEWPAKWKGQGDFVMPGTDSSYMWQYMIPDSSTPYQYNPERGFVSSANQRPADSSYPYYLARNYPSPRGFIINRKLAAMQQITVEDMMTMQTDNYNVFAEMARPIFLKSIDVASLGEDEKKYFGKLAQWNLRNDINEEAATIFELLWKQFKAMVYDDEFKNAPLPIQSPFESSLLEGLLKDSAYKFIDDISTPQKETLANVTTAAFKKIIPEIILLEKGNKLAWGIFKDTRINHLTRLPELSRLHLPIGGGTNMINATKETHGPSWRMIVSMGPQLEGYAVYPGGQSGNAGSRFYDNFVNEWVAGKYYTLWMMKQEEMGDRRVKWTMNFSK
ncbi:MAG: penicillin acylase family protein [Ferruginibacter sp.]